MISFSLNENTSLKKLLLDNNNLSGSGLKEMSSKLLNKHTCHLNHLSLANNYLCGSRNLNKFNPECIIMLADSLADNKNRSIKYLDLNYCDIGARSAKKLMESLKYNDSLIVLDISNCNITELGGVAVGNALPLINHLKILQVANNSIGPTGCKVITL